MRRINKQGFLCFLLVAAFVSLSLQASKIPETKKLWEGEAIAMEAANANFLRSVIEENTDLIVAKTIAIESASCETNPHEVKQKINEALIRYFDGIERKSSFAPKALTNTNEKIGLVFLNANSSLIIKRNLLGCEGIYRFHGGITKSNFVKAEISGKNFTQEFRIPTGYTITGGFA